MFACILVLVVSNELNLSMNGYSAINADAGVKGTPCSTLALPTSLQPPRRAHGCATLGELSVLDTPAVPAASGVAWPPRCRWYCMLIDSGAVSEFLPLSSEFSQYIKVGRRTATDPRILSSPALSFIMSRGTLALISLLPFLHVAFAVQQGKIHYQGSATEVRCHFQLDAVLSCSCAVQPTVPGSQDPDIGCACRDPFLCGQQRVDYMGLHAAGRQYVHPARIHQPVSSR
jgi:hypothetical protein